MQNAGKYLMFAGLAIVGIGIIVFFFGNKFNFLGRLPGDIRIERPNFKFFFPLTTMLLISLVLNLLIWLVRKYL